jgi:hypothetical protein
LSSLLLLDSVQSRRLAISKTSSRNLRHGGFLAKPSDVEKDLRSIRNSNPLPQNGSWPDVSRQISASLT